MNPKIMKRPMFRMGGPARVNYNTGTSLKEIEDLITKRARLRDESLDAKTSLLPLQILAGQPGLSSIRGIGDVVSILSGIGTNPETFGALAKLKGVELEKTKGELDDKITLAKLRSKAAGSSTRLKSEAAIRRIQGNITKLETKKALLNEDSPSYKKDLDEVNNAIKTEKAALRAYYNDDLRAQAYKILKGTTQFAYTEPSEEDIKRTMKSLTGMAEGGRVGFQKGTPNPEFTMPEPKPKEAVQDRQLNTLMQAAPALEDPNQARSMSEGDMYEALRRRLPQEITDDVVRLIAYNPEAFADFADIQDQSDVDSFNQKYNVQLVLPVENVT
jgi:hypothetical protein